MEEMQNQEDPKMSSVDNDQEEFELSHTDKLVGVFSEPTDTFEKIAKFPTKATDWLIPFLIFIVVTVVAGFVMMGKPTIKLDYLSKNLPRTEQEIQKQIDSGAIKEEDREKAMDMATYMLVLTPKIFKPLGTAVFFFILSGIFLLLVKYGMKGIGGYSTSLVSYGLPYYIVILEVIVTLLFALFADRFVTSFNLGEILNHDITIWPSSLLALINPFQIWFLVVVSVAYSKMFKSSSVVKYIYWIFGLFYGISIILLFFATR